MKDDQTFRFVLVEIPADPRNMFRVFRYAKRREDSKWQLWDTSCADDNNMSLRVLNDRFDSEKEAIALSAFRYGIRLWKIVDRKVGNLIVDSEFRRLS